MWSARCFHNLFYQIPKRYPGQLKGSVRSPKKRYLSSKSTCPQNSSLGSKSKAASRFFYFFANSKICFAKASQLRKFKTPKTHKILLCIAHAKMQEIVKKITKEKIEQVRLLKKYFLKRLDNLLPLWYYNCRKRK